MVRNSNEFYDSKSCLADVLHKCTNFHGDEKAASSHCVLPHHHHFVILDMGSANLNPCLQTVT